MPVRYGWNEALGIFFYKLLGYNANQTLDIYKKEIHIINGSSNIKHVFDVLNWPCLIDW